LKTIAYEDKTIDYIQDYMAGRSRMYNRRNFKYDASMATGFALLSDEEGGTHQQRLGPKMGMEATNSYLKSMEDGGLIIRKKIRKTVVSDDLPYLLVRKRDLSKIQSEI
jgi:membrane protease subunit (stomatin/prohibitin family)